MTIVTEWELKTRAAIPRSAEIKKLDAAVTTWAVKGQGLKDVNMKTVWTEFCAWKLARPAEYTKISLFADQLQTELAKQWSAMPAMVSGVSSSGTRPVGWTLVAYAGADLLPAPQHAAPLTSSQIQKVNEAIRRVQGAVELARDALIKIQNQKLNEGRVVQKVAVVTATNAFENQAYSDFFGAYGATRFETVLNNFKALALAFNGTPDFVDVRSRLVWANTYGGCVRRKLVLNSPGGQLTLTGTVQMLMGRAFLGSGNYEKTTDDTVGTMVHEFAHGVLNAVDVPETDNLGAFQCSRQSDDTNDSNFGNSTDPFTHQASTEALGMLLAQFHPEYAVVNADAYGQFTRRILTNKGG